MNGQWWIGYSGDDNNQEDVDSGEGEQSPSSDLGIENDENAAEGGNGQFIEEGGLKALGRLLKEYVVHSNEFYNQPFTVQGYIEELVKGKKKINGNGMFDTINNGSVCTDIRICRETVRGSNDEGASVSLSDVYLHLRASHAIFFQKHETFQEANPEDVFGQKVHAFLRDVCGAIGEDPSWAYVGNNREMEKSKYTQMIRNKFMVKLIDEKDKKEEDEKRAKKFLHRGKMLQAFDVTAHQHLKKVYTGRNVWNLTHANLAIIDVSVDEALASKAKDIYRGFCDRYMLNFYASASLTYLLKSTEDEIRMAVEDDVFFEKEWLIDGPLPMQQQLKKDQSEVEKIKKILEYADGNGNNDKFANLLLSTWAQLGRLDGLASHRGAATFLIFDERDPAQHVQNDKEQFFTWYYTDVKDKEPEVMSKPVHPTDTPAPATTSTPSVALPERPTSTSMHATGTPAPEITSTYPADEASKSEAGVPFHQVSEGWTKVYIQAIEAFKKGKEAYFIKIIGDQEIKKGLWTSKFIKDFKWRANFLKLARTINSETELTNRFVVSGREKRLRGAEIQKKEAIYFFQSLVNKQPRISRDLIPDSYPS